MIRSSLQLQKHLIKFRRIFIAALLALFLGPPLVFAGEPSFVRESIRARGMGNAFTAVADDEMVLFYNPAGLRSVRYNIYELLSFNATTNVKAPAPLHGSIDTDNVNINEGGLGSITGKKIYLENNLGFLSHVNSRFGWSLFGNSLMELAVHNPVFPYLQGKLFAQFGVAGGIAWSFFDYQLDVGVGGKLVQRAGVDSEIHISEPAIIAAMDGNNTKALEEANKIGDSKVAVAPDLGITYHLDGIHNLTPKIALSIQNLGGLNFGNAGNVPMTINTGISTESELQGLDIIFAADFHDLTNGNQLATGSNALSERNIKLGFELGWERLNNGHHLLSLRMGRNGPYNTQGISLNLWKLKLDLAKYSQEIGGYAGEREDKRWSFQASMIF